MYSRVTIGHQIASRQLSCALTYVVLLAVCLISANGAVAKTAVTGGAARVHVAALTPSPLVSFANNSGITPRTGLTPGPGGLLYGVDTAGGANSDGCVFTVSLSGAIAILYSFSGPDGQSPQSQLVLGPDGNLYGTTLQGGANGWGTIFQVTPGGQLTTLYPYGGSDLTLGPDGDLYGTTTLGGANNAGSIFKIGLGGNGYATIYSFSGSGSDGGYPIAGLTLANDGNFYGTTTSGAAEGAGTALPGTIFQFTQAGLLNTIHTFNDLDASMVSGRLVQGPSGDLYGVSPMGGNAAGIAGLGSIFRVTTSGTFYTVHTFEGSDGALPYAGLLLGTDGNFYGVTNGGGGNGLGTAFQLALPSTLNTIHTFSGLDGATPRGALVQATDGSLWTTAEYGGPGFTGFMSGPGTVFTLDAGLTAPATPTVTTAASASPNPVTGTGTNVSVMGGYTGAGGAAALTYDWSATGPAVVTFSPNGIHGARYSTATFAAAGSYVLTARIVNPTCQFTTSSVSVTVDQTLTSVTVTPGPTLTLTLTPTATQQFTATANDQFGNAMAVQPTFVWSLASGSVGSVSLAGLYRSGTVPGSAAVKAKSGTVMGTCAVTLNPAPVTVETPASATPNPVTGTTTALSALGAYAGAGGAGILTYTWSSTGPAAVTYSANGTNAARSSTATFTEAGSYNFTVTIAGPYSSATSSVTVTVNQTLTLITVSPGPTVTLGPPLPQTQQFTATALDQFGAALVTQPSFTWSVAPGGVGSITVSGGLYHSGTVAGSAIIKAKSGAQMGTSAVTVN
jgi:uncharacterized repeat protein (TIGR03803 family)